jgi:hypothetical protein
MTTAPNRLMGPRRPSYLMPALAPRVELAPSLVDFFR